MKKKTKIIAITLIVIIASLIFLSYFGVIHSPLLAITGTNTLSLSQAQLQSSNPYLSGQAWLLTFSEGGLGQHYYGTFSPSDVQSSTSDSSTTTKSFSVNVDYSDQICNYPITQTARTPIYNDLNKVTWTCLFTPSLSDAYSHSGFSKILYYGVSSLTCWAIGSNTQSPVGYLNSPNLGMSYTVTLTTPDGTATKTINPLDGSTQGPIGNYAYASWLGNLVSGQSCDSTSPYVPIYVNGVWRLGSSDYYNQYSSFILTKPTGAGDDIWLNTAKNLISNALSSKSFGSIQSSTSLSSAVVKVTKSTQIQFPVTTLYIKASTLGVYTPTPDFSITGTSSQCFKTGNEGSIAVTIKNNGEAGTGNVYAQCNSPFQTTGNVQVSLNQGESKTIYLTLSASANQEVKSSCTVYVESPAGTKSSSVSTCVEPQQTCTPGKTFCSLSGGQEVISQCSSDGATSTIKEICQVGYYCDATQLKCTANKPSGGNIFSKIGNFFKSLYDSTLGALLSGIGSFFGIVKLIVSILVGIVSFVISLDFLNDRKFLKKVKWLVWILSIGIALLLFWLISTIFYVGLIVFIIYYLIKTGLKFVKPW